MDGSLVIAIVLVVLAVVLVIAAVVILARYTHSSSANTTQRAQVTGEKRRPRPEQGVAGSWSYKPPIPSSPVTTEPVTWPVDPAVDTSDQVLTAWGYLEAQVGELTVAGYMCDVLHLPDDTMCVVVDFTTKATFNDYGELVSSSKHVRAYLTCDLDRLQNTGPTVHGEVETSGQWAELDTSRLVNSGGSMLQIVDQVRQIANAK